MTHDKQPGVHPSLAAMIQGGDEGENEARNAVLRIMTGLEMCERMRADPEAVIYALRGHVTRIFPEDAQTQGCGASADLIAPLATYTTNELIEDLLGILGKAFGLADDPFRDVPAAFLWTPDGEIVSRHDSRQVGAGKYFFMSVGKKGKGYCVAGDIAEALDLPAVELGGVNRLSYERDAFEEGEIPNEEDLYQLVFGAPKNSVVN
jgi:hypothetical protein